MTTHCKYLCLIMVPAALWGCAKKSPPIEKPPAPAKVQNAVKETDLTTVVLTSEAESRLGIQTAAAEYRTAGRERTFGGEVLVVPGRSVAVSAPVPGTLLVPQDGLAVRPGEKVTNGQPLYRLLLALPEKDFLSVQEEISLRKVESDLAQARVKRAQQLLAEKAGSVKQLEEAEAQSAIARASLETAQARLNLLKKGDLDSANGGLSSLIIKSPLNGVIQKIHVAPGQTVTSTTALVEIADVDPVWLRVPVYAGDAAGIDAESPAKVHSLRDFAGASTQSAKPVAAPFVGDPDSATVDLFYELPNSDLSYRPGQKVSATLSLKGPQERLVVPYSSILYDMYGGAWVYVNTAPRIYVRQRVELDYVHGESAILARGPAVGAKVVSAGAVELFGTEFGVGK